MVPILWKETLFNRNSESLVFNSSNHLSDIIGAMSNFYYFLADSMTIPFPNDGALGLSPSKSPDYRNCAYIPSLGYQNGSSIFSLFLETPSLVGKSLGLSQLVIGGFNPQAMTGSISYFPILPQYENNWAFSVQAALISAQGNSLSCD